MSETSLHTPVESIRTTLELYSRGSSPILVGTAAVHWAIASRGCDSSALPLKDVDVLATDEEVISMYKSADPDSVGRIRLKDSRLQIIPSESAAHIGAVKFDAISDNDSYDDPFIFSKHGERIYRWQFDRVFNDLVMEHDGVRFLKLPFIFWWKASVGRPNDISTMQRALNMLDSQNGFLKSEPHSLLSAIENGISGLSYSRFVP